jgi:4-hydroxyproline epimerase
MCGHGTIGMVTFALENGLITPREPGKLPLEVPAGVIDIEYRTEGDKVTAVKIRNVAGLSGRQEGIEIDVPGLGPLEVDVAYGGNFYAIIEPQGAYTGLDALQRPGHPALQPDRPRTGAREDDPGPSAGPDHPRRQPRAVGRRSQPKAADAPMAATRCSTATSAIDRSPCGTGTSARLAHLARQGQAQGRRHLRARELSSAAASSAGRGETDGWADKPRSSRRSKAPPSPPGTT